MRVFQNLTEAESEIRRDISKGTPIISTRVQQETGLELKGRERLGYDYTILEVPDSIEELIEFGQQHFEVYQKHPEEISLWLKDEVMRRIRPDTWVRLHDGINCSEPLHPLLKKTLEGHYPSYTYQARLKNSLREISETLKANPDSRRAFWPIYQSQDAFRMSDPTRIPCSLGYQAMIRNIGGTTGDRLVLFYLERSCDFDHFWLSDVYLASTYQKVLASYMDQAILPGALIHFIISFHSFDVETEEIY